MMMSENMGWTRMWIATRRTGLNGDKNQSASVAENLKKRKQSFYISMRKGFFAKMSTVFTLKMAAYITIFFVLIL